MDRRTIALVRMRSVGQAHDLDEVPKWCAVRATALGGFLMTFRHVKYETQCEDCGCAVAFNRDDRVSVHEASGLDGGCPAADGFCFQ